MPRAWIIDTRGLAKKVKNASLPASNQIKDCGAKRECPNCQFIIDNKEISHDWPGLPAGVKFDPTDLELIEHLAEKCGVGDSKPHMFIEEFIPTLDTNEGICFTHPENLPGAKKDGSSVHFFYQIRNAYATGKRKRRKIQKKNDTEQVRWHKTGKTKPVMDNGVQRGWKKIMVLYGTSKKGSKPDKSNWVMHQYHLGTHEEEKEGEYVVSKISYRQQKPTDNDGKPLVVEESDVGSVWTIPRTPTTLVPNQLRLVETPSYDDAEEIQPLIQEVEFVQEDYHPSKMEGQSIDEVEKTWLAGESQANDAINGLDDSLWCNEIFDPVYSSEYGLCAGPSTSFPEKTNDVLPPSVSNNTYCGIPELENVELDTPPDFQLTDLPFGSQDSILGWLDRL